MKRLCLPPRPVHRALHLFNDTAKIGSLFKMILALALTAALEAATSPRGPGTYSVNRVGTEMLLVSPVSQPGKTLGAQDGQVALVTGEPTLWRRSWTDSSHFVLDASDASEAARRLRATRAFPASLGGTGIDAWNGDFQWSLEAAEAPDEFLIRQRTNGWYLTATDSGIVLRREAAGAKSLWRVAVKTLDLRQIESVRLLMGDDNTGFRDPLVHYHEGTFYLYYSLVTTSGPEDGIFWHVGLSKSRNLVDWTEPVRLTPSDSRKNFGSPGSILRVGDEWIMCYQSYVMPDYRRGTPLVFGNQLCRIWITRSRDLESWSEPELIPAHGPEDTSTSMIDASLVEDRDEPGKWWVFYEPRLHTNASWSRDFKTWHPLGRLNKPSGENTQVWVDDGEYFMIHSPHQAGVQILRSKNLRDWTPLGPATSLGREDWKWAERRVTAGYVLDLRADPRVGKYLLFFHGQGPQTKDPIQSTEVINSGTSIGIAWSKDLLTWDWPGKPASP